MISRITGILESIEKLSAHLALSNGELVREVLVPAYLTPALVVWTPLALHGWELSAHPAFDHRGIDLPDIPRLPVPVLDPSMRHPIP